MGIWIREAEKESLLVILPHCIVPLERKSHEYQRRVEMEGASDYSLSVVHHALILDR